MPKRCAISFFYDEHGILDDYITYLLQAMRPFVDKIVMVVNGSLTEESEAKARRVSDQLIIRENVGFDVWAYKTGLAHIQEVCGFEDFDEILMFNHTFYGPLYPFDEMFRAMEARDCDFWGITAHKAMVETTGDGERAVPFHLNSHFIAVRRRMLSDPAFARYWEDMPPINSYFESIELHELKFTEHFQDLGFSCGVYVDPNDFGSAYSAFMDIDQTVEARSPILKRRAFFHDPTFLDERAVDLPRALHIVEEKTQYPTSLIWTNILRSTPARVLYANASMLRVLSDSASSFDAGTFTGKLAVCAHAHYAELIDEILDLTAAIPVPYDLIVTTDSAAKKTFIEAAAAKRSGIANVIVRLLEEVRGRDMSSLLVTCRDLFDGDRYDLVCRVHTKKSPQVEASRANFFKRHMLENTLASSAYVTNVIELFEKNERLGIAMPPMIHVSTPTLGHAWFINREKALHLAAMLDLQVPIDAGSPLAIYGGMYWFRPKALRKLFGRFDYRDFEPEPSPVDGGIVHALERLFVYVAQDAGYFSLAIAAPRQIAHAYTALEFKADKLASCLPTGRFRDQVELLSAFKPALRSAMLEKATSSDDSMLQRLNIAESRVAQAEAERRSALHQNNHLRVRMQKLLSSSETQGLPVTIKTLFSPYSARGETRIIQTYLRKLSQAAGGLGAPLERAAILEYTKAAYLDGRELFYLFDSRFYMQSYPDVADAGVHPLAHFIEHGWREGRSPHALFDTKYVRQLQPQYANPASLPLADFIRNKSAKPHALFDSDYYSAQFGPGELKGMHPLEHYLTFDADNDKNPHPLFDTRFYMAHSPELVRFKINPLVHFLRYGAKEGRNPSAMFATRAYLRENPDVAKSGANPLVHYVTSGIFEGRSGGLSKDDEKRIMPLLMLKRGA